MTGMTVQERKLSKEETLEIIREIVLLGYESREKIHDYVRERISREIGEREIEGHDGLAALAEMDPNEIKDMLEGRKPVSKELFVYFTGYVGARNGHACWDFAPLRDLSEEQYKALFEKIMKREPRGHEPAQIPVLALFRDYAFGDAA